jgi:hypothetical protein
MNLKTLFPALALCVAGIAATPAHAEESYRIPASVVEAEKLTEDQRTRRAAMRTEAAFVVLSAVDMAITVQCLKANECTESNPLAKSHSIEQMVAINSVFTIGHYFFVKRLAKTHPKAALRVAQVSVAVRGTVVGLNIRARF